jgi:hypothetical protein
VGRPVASGGTITLDDQPLEGATIVFTPDGSGQLATALSGSGGRFRLTTRNTNDGAIPGPYKITVQKKSGGGAGGGVEMKPGSPEYVAKMKEMTSKTTKTTVDTGGIHPNYSDPAKTTLRWEIPKGGDTNIQLKLNKSGT